jgi:hypothetical protein
MNLMLFGDHPKLVNVYFIKAVISKRRTREPVTRQQQGMSLGPDVETSKVCDLEVTAEQH